MTDAAIGKLRHADVILLHQLSAQRELVGWLPSHVEHFRFGPNELRRVIVAIQAPFHVQRVLLPGQRHLVHAPMTRRAADSLLDVDGVIEKGEVRQVMNSIPAKRLVSHAFAHGRQHRRTGPELRMTTHTDIRRRDSCECGIFHGSVTIAAVDSQSTDVMFVAEGHRLRRSNTNFCRVRRPINGVKRPTSAQNQQQRAGESRARDGVGFALKNLCHWTTLSFPARKRILTEALRKNYCPRFLFRNCAPGSL